MQNDKTTTLLMVAAILFLVYLMYGKDMLPGSSKNERPATVITAEDDEVSDVENSEQEYDEEEEQDMMHYEENEEIPEDDESADYMSASASAAAPTGSRSTSGKFEQKFRSRNLATPGGCYKGSSFDGSRRGNQAPSGWDKYFDQNNDIIGGSQRGDSNDFLPVDESGGNLAVFKSQGGPVCGSNQGCQPEDLFDVDKYLPQEVNDDWFEVQPEPVSVKNRHLINITKPIGVNTIGTSMRNSSYDIRGAPSCPKTVVSAWLQSSIEGDSNLKPLF